MLKISDWHWHPLSLAKIWPIIGHNLETVQNGGGSKLVLITNKKSHMSFRLVPKSVTLNDIMAIILWLCDCISPNSLAFRAHYIKVVEDNQYILWVKCRPSPKNLVSAVYHLWWYSQGITPSECIKVKWPPLLAKIWHIISHNLEMVQDRR